MKSKLLMKLGASILMLSLIAACATNDDQGPADNNDTPVEDQGGNNDRPADDNGMDGNDNDLQNEEDNTDTDNNDDNMMDDQNKDNNQGNQ
ncbi:hypothetical protein JNUCC74_16420 [Cerasibacillus sp. JNUCC 74]|jgi:hypothetical protein|uniref:hypothetical protein n=1 Tax=Virgibacillus proomii TaxID=84407 RepID=UPI0009867453|nr:hypothetical protein [Virgibacillus proomii]